MAAMRRYVKSVDDYCIVLGVSSRATSRELKKAYRGLVKKWHPDQFLHDPRRLKDAKEKLQEINEAYHALRRLHLDPKKHLSQPSRTPTQRTSTAHRKANTASKRISNARIELFMEAHVTHWRKYAAMLRRVLIEAVKDPWIMTVLILMLVVAIAVDWFY
jgi:hypothetical protein